ncbi:MAG: hypothetical protein HYS27_06230 [Deltaproteobacteria bacterium]|nr:hypothetical protein [Deltaproteobacteria bacterium]
MSRVHSLPTRCCLTTIVATLLVVTASCDDQGKDNGGKPGPAGPTAPALDKVARADFNRRAAELFLPLFWIEDKNANQALDVDELAVLWGIGAPAPADAWVKAGAFTPAFLEAYAAMQKPADAGADPADQARRKAVLEELGQGRPTLLLTDTTTWSANDQAIVKNIVEAAQLIEQIYAKQVGVAELRAQVAADDKASQMLVYRNQTTACSAPKTEKNPDCSALTAKQKPTSGLYPANLQGADGKFCEELEKRKDADKLLHQFVTVAARAGGKSEGNPATDELDPVPYHVAFKAEMEAVSAKLKAAATHTGASEAAFAAYLFAAAQSFLDNKWGPADEAWAKMNAENSKWYLRIGPDETYFEPCSRKAGFHVSFARINQDSLAWQKKLEPFKTEMEGALAALAGPPYKAREVSFHLPDFIDVVLNAGDSRDSLGGTIGQSLPNWGAVANEGRGRTVAMVNLYTDKDSEAAWQSQASSLLCKDTMAAATFDPKLAVMSTVLHEAAHNLGPAHEYKVAGKTDDQIFGGPLASMLEELKAQTAALYFSEWLVGKGAVEPKAAVGSHLRDVTWAFGHIAAGMYNAEGKIKAYSQLAAIQMGTLYRQGALTWNPEELAANGTDKGCIRVDTAKWKPAVDELAKVVLGIKGRGDKALADKTRKGIVDDDAEFAKLREVITERWLRSPKASFVYGIK